MKLIHRIHPISFFALLWIVISSNSAYALQAKNIKDNGTAYATISIKGLTRIAVDNDRILNLRGPSDMYTLQNDNQQGAVYLKLNQNTAKPFSVFIATEQNHNYVLKLMPKDQNGDTILLKPTDAFNPDAVHWEGASPYTEAITELMAAMVKGTPPEGYAVEDVKGARKQYLGSIADTQLVKVYTGAHLQGQVYMLNNRTDSPIHVTESEFYKTGDRAISLSALNINPQGQVFLYKVTGHDE